MARRLVTGEEITKSIKGGSLDELINLMNVSDEKKTDLNFALSIACKFKRHSMIQYLIREGALTVYPYNNDMVEYLQSLTAQLGDKIITE